MRQALHVKLEALHQAWMDPVWKKAAYVRHLLDERTAKVKAAIEYTRPMGTELTRSAVLRLSGYVPGAFLEPQSVAAHLRDAHAPEVGVPQALWEELLETVATTPQLAQSLVLLSQEHTRHNRYVTNLLKLKTSS